MKTILATLSFYAKNQGVQSFNPKDRATVRAVKSLEKRGYLIVHWDTHQAEHTGKVFV